MGLEVITEHRGISIETLEECGIEWDDTTDYSVIFPYRHLKGEWYRRKGLDPRLRGEHKGPKILSPSGAEHHMYNPLRLGPNASLVFYCEGEYDTLSVIDAGFPAVGNQGANSFAPGWCRLFQGAVNVIAYDGDTAGVESGNKLSRWMSKFGIKPIQFPLEEGEDLNDLHMEGKLAPRIVDLLADYDVEW